jgi:CRP-like cAMP-binding protein
MSQTRIVDLDHFAIARQNRRLAGLSAECMGRLAPHLEYLPLVPGNVLYEPRRQPDHLYFPITGIISKVQIMSCGSSTEVAMVGREGMVGTSLLMGGETMNHRAMVRHAGFGYRIKAGIAVREFDRGGDFQAQVLLFVHTLITQMAQTAVCNRHHSLDQQLCRLLLASLDCVRSDELRMTQELIATLLGVRREGVNEAAGKLQFAGIIRYSRGRITVMDRLLLEQRACSCYALLKQEQGRRPEMRTTADLWQE